MMCQFHPSYCLPIRVAPTTFVVYERCAFQSEFGLKTKQMSEENIIEVLVGVGHCLNPCPGLSEWSVVVKTHST